MLYCAAVEHSAGDILELPVARAPSPTPSFCPAPVMVSLVGGAGAAYHYTHSWATITMFAPPPQLPFISSCNLCGFIETFVLVQHIYLVPSHLFQSKIAV